MNDNFKFAQEAWNRHVERYQLNHQREYHQAFMAMTKEQVDAICGLPTMRVLIESVSSNGYRFSQPTPAEQAANLKEHAELLTGCTENDPVMDSDRARVASEAMRQAMKPDPKPAAPPPKSSDGLLTTAPFGQRVGGGRWGAS